ncbi:MAG: helix-turn-helix domain-containing protein, partial [Acidobacteria bacterium]|nr:helix-turn-helix domain-containing protein [Acidobacteriota bacterium]
KITQQQLGDLLGVGRVSVTHWETGVRRPSRMAQNFVKHLSRKEAESDAKKG